MELSAGKGSADTEDAVYSVRRVPNTGSNSCTIIRAANTSAADANTNAHTATTTTDTFAAAM